MNKTTSKYFLVAFLIGIHFLQASTVRPVADDYTLLRIYSQEGFTSSTWYIWNNFGGNITPAVIRAAYLSFSLDASNWYGFMAFSITTSLLVIVSYMVLITWLTNRSMRQITRNDLVIALLASLAFEGLFTPGLSSAYLFGAAAGVHLWPVCIFILSLKLIESYSDKESKFRNLGFLLLLIFLGFVVGNSGLAESGAIFLALLTLAIWIQIKTPQHFSSRFRIAINSYLLGVGLGFATIFAAPGFTNRNDRLGKIDSSLFSMLESFRSSMVSFSGELVTHPVWLFAILIVASRNFSFKVDSSRAQALLMYFSFTFVMLVLGSSFGYAAWHQSSGLVFLIAPSALCLSSLSRSIPDVFNKLGLAHKNIALVAVTVILVGLLVRGVVVQVNRSNTWDSNFFKNYCAVVQSSKSPLLGAEIKYWPIGLGIEDVNRWPWMEKEYKFWMSSLNPDTLSKCSQLD